MTLQEIRSALRMLSDGELCELNTEIVTRLRFNRELNRQVAKSELRIGDEVYFWSKRGDKQIGKIIKINSKNVKVLTNATPGVIWTVAPTLLHKV